MKKLSLLFVLYLFAITGSTQELNPGVDRWVIKTSVVSGAATKTVSLQTLLELPSPITRKTDAPDASRIPTPVNGLKEGDIITTTGWLELVALEDDAKEHRDGDFHIQIRIASAWGDSCMIVEIPDGDFISDLDLKEKCQKERQWMMTNLLKNKMPGTSGNVMSHPVHVKVTGQLFFDAIHYNGNKGPYRGKHGMKSYTCWELHPVTSIEFAP